MEQEIPQALQSAQSILVSLPDEEYNKLCDESVKKRKRIVETILSKLQMQETESQGDILQSIPLAMLMDGRFMEAANFIVLSISRGGYFDSNIVIEVMRNLGTSMLKSLIEGDEDASKAMKETLYGLWKNILVLEQYNTDPTIYITIGSIFEGEGRGEIAIQSYTEALKLGSTDAYICLANIYEKSGRYTESAGILKQAYDTTKDERFLQGYISALSKSGKRHEAFRHYTELLKKDSKPILQTSTANTAPVIVPASVLQPFIVFTEEVHSDSDLDDFSDLLTVYHTEGTFLPNTQLRNLAENASIFISNEIEGINKTLREIMMTPSEGWTDEQVSLHRGFVKRRLYLMQTHIIILQNHYYLDVYLHDMHQLAINGDSEDHKILREFFAEYFNPYTQAAYDHVSENEGEKTEKMDIFGAIRLHLVHINAIFSQGTLYEDIRDTIEPFIDECLRRAGEGDDIDIEESDTMLQYSNGSDTDSYIITTVEDSREDPEMMKLRKESKNYNALSASTMDMYEKYVGYLDAKYGMFYRRSIQQLVRDRAAIPPSAMGELKASLIKHNGDKERAFIEVIHNLPILLTDPYIAVFFFLEKIILGGDILEEGQDIDAWITKYGFDTLGVDDALLLTSMLYENAHQDSAIQYAINMPGMLQEPQVLYMVMENILYIDEDVDTEIESVQDAEGETGSSSQNLIEVLNAICKREYDIDDFFEYFEGFIHNVLEDDDATDTDIGYTLLASGYLRCIREQKEDKTIEEFVAAGGYGIAQGYISAADLLEELDQYPKALEYFLAAHKLAPSIITIRRIATLYMRMGNFEEAWKLLDDSTIDGYDVRGYIAACYFYEGKTGESLMEFSKILSAGDDIDFAYPDGFEEDIAEHIKVERNIPMASIENYRTTIVGSYIFANHMSIVPDDYLTHVQNILKLLSTYELTDACNMLISTMPLLTGAIILPHDISINERTLVYLELHLEKIHSTILNLYKIELLTNGNVTSERALNLLKLLNGIMITAIFIVKYFPDSQKYITRWQRAMNFYATDEYQPSPDQYIHIMPSTIQ